jgi:hypothetical protein
MEELSGWQQPQKMTAHALLVALHPDPKQAAWVQATNY